MHYYDPQHNRLIYVNQAADTEFWDQHWQSNRQNNLARLAALSQTKKTFVTELTKRYLQPADGAILEGGCGQGQQVAALTNNGYCCIGVDSAPKTVQALHEAAPQLAIRLGDVRQLDFPDHAFIGYWSLGVIEHFWEGYDAIAREMQRVIAPGGYLFLAFPYMSPLRRYKAHTGQYTPYTAPEAPVGFYQFALDEQRVLAHFAELGFTCLQTAPQGSVLGLKNEATVLKESLRRFHDYRGRSPLVRVSRYLLEQLCRPVSSHAIVLVLHRTKNL